MIDITVTVNGRSRPLAVAPDAFLLDVLREACSLTGAKECCLEGECGACTIIIDGRSVNSCLVLAAEVEGATITTVEGIGGTSMHPLQTAFLDNAAAQCGFCIPGQLMSACALLQRNPDPLPEEVREAMAGNLCRCGGYEQIGQAVLDAAQRMAE